MISHLSAAYFLYIAFKDTPPIRQLVLFFQVKKTEKKEKKKERTKERKKERKKETKKCKQNLLMGH